MKWFVWTTAIMVEAETPKAALDPAVCYTRTLWPVRLRSLPLSVLVPYTLQSSGALARLRVMFTSSSLLRIHTSVKLRNIGLCLGMSETRG